MIFKNGRMRQDRLEILSNDAALVPNTFIKQESSNHLAIIFPGLGYNADMPLLYYTTNVLSKRGADVLQLRYTYQNEAFQSLPEQAQYEKIVGDCTAAFSIAKQQREYSQITLVGKSLGTLALGHLLTQNDISSTKFVWLTPLLRNEYLRNQITSRQHQALFVIGTKDPHYSADVVKEVEDKTGGESLVAEHANHSLEVEGVLESTLVMQTYVAKLSDFLDKP
jgi:hypothetical protein